MSVSDDQQYNDYAIKMLSALTPVFANAAIGDFSDNIPIPDENNEFTQLYVGIQIMLDVIREQLEELRRQKEELKAVLENTPDIVASFDRSFRHVYVNNAVEKIAGKPANEYFGKTYRDLGMPEALCTQWETAIQSVFDTEKTVSLEFSLPSLAGDTLYFHSSIAAEYDQSGTIAYVIGITHDITELIRAQQTAQKLASIVENSDDAIMGISLDGKITSWNKGAEKMYGYASTEVIGQPHSILIPEDQKEEITQILEKMKGGVSLEHYETIRVRKDGKRINVAKTLSPTRDPSGNINGYSAIATDITLRKIAENMLIQSNDKLEQEKSKVDAIIASIGDGVFAVDQTGMIIRMNAVAERLSGYTSNEAVGKHYKEIFTIQYETNRDRPYPLFIEEVITTGKTKDFTNHSVMISKDQQITPITYKATPIITEKQVTYGCVVVVRDNSRERSLEKAKDEFISIAAHQLRTPLGIMRWSLEMILEKKLGEVSDPIQKKIVMTYQNNQRMILLVNDLLNVSKIEQGKTQNEPEEINIISTIKLLIEEIMPETKKKALQVEFHEPDTPPQPVFVDIKRLRAVIQNLLSNAIKYNTDHGKITISIQILPQELELRIDDTGIGIPVPDQDHIYNKFFRAENATLSDTDGSGLGLFIVQSYVKEWGGKVWFESPTITVPLENGKEHTYGSTFHVTIPFHV